MRRKQTSIRFSRSALPYRYLRYISWNGHRPQPSTSWVFPSLCHSCATFSRRCLYPKAATAALLLLSLPRRQRKHLLIFSPRKENTTLPLLSRAASLVLLYPRQFARHPRCLPRPVRRLPSTSLSAAFHKQKMRARSIAPRTRSKKRRLLAQENTRRHAWLTRSCFGRKNLFIDGPHSLLPFFLSPFLQGKEKRKQKQIQQVRIHRSDSLRSSSRCTRLARRASSAKIYVAIATRFVQDCVEDLGLLAASMERIPKCSWHIKDHCLGVIKASRISPPTSASFFLLKIFPTKI